MNGQVILRGIAWNHSRAFPPLVATAQRFEELYPGVEIRWEKRSLHDFGHAGLSPLAQEYDLLIVDHPMMGAARGSGTLLDLGRLVDRSFIDELRLDSVGRSYESYVYEGRLLALPIDAAAPTASYRPDLLDRLGLQMPRTWDEVLDRARKKLVVMPGFHADVFLNFMSLYFSRTTDDPGSSLELNDSETARQCLDELRELAGYMPDVVYEWNPISVYEQMAATDQYAYCPFAFSYSNYSRAGFAKNPIVFAAPVLLSSGVPLSTVLGGTGIAISAGCGAVEAAVRYARHLAGAEWQRTLYGLSGGQPARLSAWCDETLNLISHRFFERTLETMKRAYVRPRHSGYIEFQEKAGVPIVQYLRSGGSSANVLEELKALWRQSQKGRSR